MKGVFVGVAGWTIPSQVGARFPGKGSHLERYAEVLNAVEINSSFHREHKPETYARWAASVPEDFRFAVKLSQYFTREKELKETGARLKEVLSGISALGDKWKILLVQLPPKLEFHTRTVSRFLSALHNRADGVRIVLEPRHPSWAEPNALRLLAEYEVSKVLADPEPCPIRRALRASMENHVRYFRLHGTPVKYRSRYSQEAIARLAQAVRKPFSPCEETWCIFDNTTYGHGTENALELGRELSHHRRR